MKWFFCFINYICYYLCILGILCMFEFNKFVRREKLEFDDFNLYIFFLEVMIII